MKSVPDCVYIISNERLDDCVASARRVVAVYLQKSGELSVNLLQSELRASAVLLFIDVRCLFLASKESHCAFSAKQSRPVITDDYDLIDYHQNVFRRILFCATIGSKFALNGFMSVA